MVMPLFNLSRKQMEELANNEEFIKAAAENIQKYNETKIKVTKVSTEEDTGEYSRGEFKSQRRVKDANGKWIWVASLVLAVSAGSILVATIIASAPVTAPAAFAAGILTTILIYVFSKTCPWWLKPIVMAGNPA